MEGDYDSFWIARGPARTNLIVMMAILFATLMVVQQLVSKSWQPSIPIAVSIMSIAVNISEAVSIKHLGHAFWQKKAFQGVIGGTSLLISCSMLNLYLTMDGEMSSFLPDKIIQCRMKQGVIPLPFLIAMCLFTFRLFSTPRGLKRVASP